jgi:hypothetical protein
MATASSCSALSVNPSIVFQGSCSSYTPRVALVGIPRRVTSTASDEWRGEVVRWRQQQLAMLSVSRAWIAFVSPACYGHLSAATQPPGQQALESEYTLA